MQRWLNPRTARLARCAAVALSIISPSVALSESRLFSAATTKMSETSTLTIAQFPCLNDNYGYLLHCEQTGQTAAFDTPEAKPYQEQLDKRGWKLTHIFNTHHHVDHTGGNAELKKDGVKVVGPDGEKSKIPGIDQAVKGGDTVVFGADKVAKVLFVGGHTLGHIAYYFPDQKIVFVGDSLFALGCGRMFEGDPDMFWKSLSTLRDLPDDTVVYCAHEYTMANAKFALSVEPGNTDLVSRAKEVEAMRARGEPTVPSLMGLEKKTNPFLRCDFSEEIRMNVGVTSDDSDAMAFAKVRQAKDSFRG